MHPHLPWLPQADTPSLARLWAVAPWVPSPRASGSGWLTTSGRPAVRAGLGPLAVTFAIGPCRARSLTGSPGLRCGRPASCSALFFPPARGLVFLTGFLHRVEASFHIGWPGFVCLSYL